MRSLCRLGVIAGLWAGTMALSPAAARADAASRPEAAVAPDEPGDASDRGAGHRGASAPAGDVDPVGEGVVIGEHARLETAAGPVHVWRPRGYDPRTAMTVVYVHGYGIDVDEAWWGHGLPEQFGHAQINALFIACEAPVDARDEVRWTSLTRLLAEVAAAGSSIPAGRVAAIGHSGAYRTLEHWVRDPRLDTLVLLDAGYGPLHWVHAWIRGDRDRRLVNIGDDTRIFTDRLHRYLPGTVALRDFGAFADPARVARLARERIVYVRSTIGHYPIASGAVALPSVLRILGARHL